MNCDQLLQEVARLREENRQLAQDIGRTERTMRQLDRAGGADEGTIWDDLTGRLDSVDLQNQVRRSLGDRETPVGADGQFTNFRLLGERMDELKAEEMGVLTEALIGDWKKNAPGDFAWVTQTTQPEEFAQMIAKGYADFGLDYDSMLQAASTNAAPFARLVENGTRLRVLADISKNSLLEDIGAIRGFMQEAGTPPPAELGQKFFESYKKALVLERHAAFSRRRTGQFLQSLQRSVIEGGETPQLSRDIWAPPPPDQIGNPLGLTVADMTEDTVLGKVLKAASDGPDGVEALKQLELDIRVDTVDPASALDSSWRSSAARRDLGYFKDSQLTNPDTQILKSWLPNAIMERYGVIRTALENGPKMAPFGTKLLRTSMKDRLDGIQIAWEANQAMKQTMKLGFRELYWERFLDGDTPFANDVAMHGKPMDPGEALATARNVLWEPIDWKANPLGNDSAIRKVRDKLHVATKLTLRALAKKVTGVDLPITPAFSALATVDNVTGMRMYRFKMRNDLMLEARRNGVQLGLMDPNGTVNTGRLNQWVDQRMEESVYAQVPTEQNLLDFRRQHNLTPEVVGDEDLRAYMIQSRVAGQPILNDPLQTGAWDYAQRLRMQHDPEGPVLQFADKTIKGAQQSWIGDALVPYRKIPLNSLAFDFATGTGPVIPTVRYLSERLHGRTPTPEQIAEVEAAWVLSALLAGSFFALDNGFGKLTGNGPVDPKQRREWEAVMRAEGRVPNSVFGIPIPLGGIPLLNTMFLWKDVSDAMDAAGASNLDQKNVGLSAMQVLTGTLVRQTPLATLQRILETVSRGDEQAWAKFFGWIAAGQGNPMSGPTRALERYSGNTSRDFFSYPKLTPADQQQLDQLPDEIKLTEDNLRNLLVSLQPALGRIAGVARREKDWLGRDIHLPEQMDQEGHPSGMPGFYTSPVHRELEKQDLLDPPSTLLAGRLQGVPLSPEGQKEFNGYIGSTVGADDFVAQRTLYGKAFTYVVSGTKEVIVDLPNGEKMRFGSTVQIPTALVSTVQRSIRGKTVYQALNTLINSPEYKALQANPITSSNPEVRDLPPEARRQQPGPWMINAIKSYYELRAVGQLEASDTPQAREFQALRRQKTLKSLEDALQKTSAIGGMVTPAQ
jgi:hypothetical protein